MTQILKPANLSLTWASGGDVLNPGDTKYATGWQVEIPPRQWFNYLDNRQDTAIAHINQHGVAVWDANTEYQANKSYCQGKSNGTIYRCVQTHTNQDPELDVGNVYWIVAFASAGDFYTKAEVDGAFLSKAANGSDILNAATFRNNISVYSQAQTYTKTEVDAKTTVASTAQAQDGISNTTLMTPLRTEEWGNANVLGMGQTWQDVTGSRSLNTTYTNTTGKPIYVAVSLVTTTGADTLSVIVGGVTIFTGDLGGDPNESGVFSFIVPSSATYRLTSTGNTLANWAELR